MNDWDGMKRREKTVNLEMRPVYTRKEESTRGYVFVVMLAYLILRRLRRAWAGFDLTVEEGVKRLATICSMEVTMKGQNAHCQKTPRPRQQSRELLGKVTGGITKPEPTGGHEKKTSTSTQKPIISRLL